MSDDYGQFVALDMDIDLEPIETFKLKINTMIKPMNNAMKKDCHMKKDCYMKKDCHMKKESHVEYIYWYLLGACIIMLF